jgi:hypothetical protein
MGQSVKAILQLILIIAGITALVLWTDDSIKPTLEVTFFRIAAPAVSLLIVVVLWRNSRRKETLPDHLAKASRSYFERDGFCFAFVPIVQDGVCLMQIYFQNRYARACNARVVLQPPVKSLGIRRLPIPGIDVDIDCDGGAFGVCRVPWPIGAAMQGKKVAFEIACATRFAQGRGKLLRYREGLRAGTPGSGRNVAATAGLLLVGVVSVSRPATVTFTLPTGVAEQTPAGIEPVVEIVYRPDLPTGGFPVVPVGPSQASATAPPGE